MACFLAPTAAAAVTIVIRKKVSPAWHIEWLLAMLSGGSLMLMVEHIARQEVVPIFPFFTAGFSQLLPEIVRVGGVMTAAIVAVWLVLVVVANAKMHPKIAQP